MRALMLVVAATLLLSGCDESPPRLDATNETTLAASMREMTAGMDDAEKKAFTGQCAALTMGDMMKAAFSSPKEGRTVKGPEVFRSLHGMTVAEIRAKAAAGVRKK